MPPLPRTRVSLWGNDLQSQHSTGFGSEQRTVIYKVRTFPPDCRHPSFEHNLLLIVEYSSTIAMHLTKILPLLCLYLSASNAVPLDVVIHVDGNPLAVDEYSDQLDMPDPPNRELDMTPNPSKFFDQAADVHACLGKWSTNNSRSLH